MLIIKEKGKQNKLQSQFANVCVLIVYVAFTNWLFADYVNSDMISVLRIFDPVKLIDSYQLLDGQKAVTKGQTLS